MHGHTCMAELNMAIRHRGIVYKSREQTINALCTRSTAADFHKRVCFKCMANNNLVKPLRSSHTSILSHPSYLYVYPMISMHTTSSKHRPLCNMSKVLCRSAPAWDLCVGYTAHRTQYGISWLHNYARNNCTGMHYKTF